MAVHTQHPAVQEWLKGLLGEEVYHRCTRVTLHFSANRPVEAEVWMYPDEAMATGVPVSKLFRLVEVDE